MLRFQPLFWLAGAILPIAEIQTGHCLITPRLAWPAEPADGRLPFRALFIPLGGTRSSLLLPRRRRPGRGERYNNCA